MNAPTSEATLIPYLPPTADPVALTVVPRLASWERKDSPEQVRLGGYLDRMQTVFAQAAAQLDGHVSAQLSVGLPEHVDLLVYRDLDNFLDPLAKRIGTRVVSWWATKTHAANSQFAVGPATQAEPEQLDGWAAASARSAASATTSKWKQEINEQIAATATRAPDGPLEMQIVFGVGPARNWVNLWKPAIDALDPILGRTDPRRPFHPRDDRVVRLGLHRLVDSSLGNAVELAVWWRPKGTQSPPLDLDRMVAPTAGSSFARQTGRDPITKEEHVQDHQQRASSTSERLAEKVVKFRNDEVGYLEWIASQKGGWVVNTDRNPKAKYLQLHKAWCPTISDPRRAGAYTERTYIKFCAVDKRDLDAYFQELLDAKPRWNCRQCG